MCCCSTLSGSARPVTKSFPALHSNVAAIAGLVFRIATLQMEPGLLVAFLVQVVEQGGVTGCRKLTREFVETRKQRQETGFRISGGHAGYGGFELDESVEELLFSIGHDSLVAWFAVWCEKICASVVGLTMSRGGSTALPVPKRH